MKIPWITAFNLLFPLISNKHITAESDTSLFETPELNPAYYSGSRFIKLAQQFNPEIPHYKELIDIRQQQGKSTSRESYFHDILKEQKSEVRLSILEEMVKTVQNQYPDIARVISATLSGEQTVGKAELLEDNWNSSRLNSMFSQIDKAILSGSNERAIILCYTCVEGVFKTFIMNNIPTELTLNEIIKMSRVIKKYIHDKNLYTEEISNSVINISSVINSTRNKNSESHFNQLADRNLSTYVRDLTNSLCKLLISHIN